jgi:hypothetical protein
VDERTKRKNRITALVLWAIVAMIFAAVLIKYALFVR